jgi:predicted CXXCH cytochrome family protein
MKRGLVLLAAAGLVCGIAVAQSQPWRSDQRPTVRVQNCTTAGCHSGQISHKHLHGPAAVSACDMCHTYKDPAAHSFQLKREGRDLCTFCHAGHARPTSVVPHEPYASGDCLSCHNPHGGHTRALLTRPDTNSLCLSCHDTVLSGGSHVHKPLHDGSCTDCHKSHGGDHARLLLKPGRALCLSCHDQVQHHLHESAHAHKPMEGDCLQCHTAHVSPVAMQLKKPARDLCLSCHEDVGAKAMGSSHPHSVVLEGQACLHCHQPHASSRKHLVHEDPSAACLNCHREPEKPKPVLATGPMKPVLRSDLRRNASAPAAQPVRLASPVRELRAGTEGLHLHGPVADSDCASCHAVHGGERQHLLKAAYTTEFYQQFSPDAYALCFSCHDPRLVTAQKTDSFTKFRDGERNLHYLHVNQEQGRSCRTCHTVHASQHSTQIRETAVFGNWELPINFVKTDTGGSCAAGCHREYSYSRTGAAGALPIEMIKPAAPPN